MCVCEQKRGGVFLPPPCTIPVDCLAGERAPSYIWVTLFSLGAKETSNALVFSPKMLTKLAEGFFGQTYFLLQISCSDR